MKKRQALKIAKRYEALLARLRGNVPIFRPQKVFVGVDGDSLREAMRIADRYDPSDLREIV
jgi:hypothetical protein